MPLSMNICPQLQFSDISKDHSEVTRCIPVGACFHLVVRGIKALTIGEYDLALASSE